MILLKSDRIHLYMERMDRKQHSEHPQEMNPNAIQNKASGCRGSLSVYDLVLINKHPDLQLNAQSTNVIQFFMYTIQTPHL